MNRGTVQVSLDLVYVTLMQRFRTALTFVAHEHVPGILTAIPTSGRTRQSILTSSDYTAQHLEQEPQISEFDLGRVMVGFHVFADAFGIKCCVSSSVASSLEFLSNLCVD